MIIDKMSSSKLTGGKKQPVVKKNDGEPSAQWNNIIYSNFIDILINEVNEFKNTEGGGFKSQQWNRMTTLFNYNTGLNFTSQQLQNKYKSMKNNWRIWKDIENNSGFGWDEKNQLFTSSDEVWSSYIASHPAAKPFRYRTLFRADDLGTLFR